MLYFYQQIKTINETVTFSGDVRTLLPCCACSGFITFFLLNNNKVCC